MTRRRLSLAGALLVARQDDSLLRRHFLNPLGVDAAEQVLKSNVEAEVAKRFAQFEQSMRSLMGQKRGPDHASFPAGPDTKKLKGKGQPKGHGKGVTPSALPAPDGRRPVKFFMKSNKHWALLKLSTPEGKKCWNFQKGNCTKPSCPFVHKMCCVRRTCWDGQLPVRSDSLGTSGSSCTIEYPFVLLRSARSHDGSSKAILWSRKKKWKLYLSCATFFSDGLGIARVRTYVFHFLFVFCCFVLEGSEGLGIARI